MTSIQLNTQLAQYRCPTCGEYLKDKGEPTRPFRYLKCSCTFTETVKYETVGEANGVAESPDKAFYNFLEHLKAIKYRVDWEYNTGYFSLHREWMGSLVLTVQYQGEAPVESYVSLERIMEMRELEKAGKRVGFVYMTVLENLVAEWKKLQEKYDGTTTE